MIDSLGEVNPRHLFLIAVSNTISSFEFSCVSGDRDNVCPVAVVAVSVTLPFQKKTRTLPDGELLRSLLHL